MIITIIVVFLIGLFLLNALIMTSYKQRSLELVKKEKENKEIEWRYHLNEHDKILCDLQYRLNIPDKTQAYFKLSYEDRERFDYHVNKRIELEKIIDDYLDQLERNLNSGKIDPRAVILRGIYNY